MGIAIAIAVASALAVAAGWSMGRLRLPREPLAPGAEPTLKTVRGGTVQYYLSLPIGWTPDRNWPILVTIDGVGHTFRRNNEDFVRARKDLPFILVTPCVTSNGNDPAETRAVLSIVREVQQTNRGAPRIFITGFSAGGHLMWQFVFLHPEMLAGAAPAAANFAGRGITRVSKVPDGQTLPIQGFQGTADWHRRGLDRQWDAAAKFAAYDGYRNVTRTAVPGAPHEAFPDQVIAFCAGLLR